METTVTVPEKYSEVAKQLNSNVLSVIGADSLMGFEKAYLIADAAGKLKVALTTEYMKPIMELQGNKLGFKTDKDSSGGYPEAAVKNCLIEAVLTGVQPFGNHFNIIAGNCYITKEGFGYLLQHFKGLSYEIIPSLPRIDATKGSGAVSMKIKWTLGGNSNEREIDFAIKVNNFMGADAVIGKATRKARAWLFNTINGFEISDGDVTDVDARVMSSKMNPVDVADNKERERIIAHIEKSKTVKQLNEVAKAFENDDAELVELFNAKFMELEGGKK